jgi:hypothetical protein
MRCWAAQTDDVTNIEGAYAVTRTETFNLGHYRTTHLTSPYYLHGMFVSASTAGAQEHKNLVCCLRNRVKSGQITLFKMCCRSAASVSGSACTSIGETLGLGAGAHTVREQRA